MELFRRRGNPVPEGVKLAADEFEEQLDMILEGTGEIPDAVPRNELGLAMSNLRIDPRFTSAKIRVQQIISAGQTASQKPVRSDYVSNYPEL